MNAPCVPFVKYVTSKLRPFPWANCRIAGAVYTNFLLSTRPCAASRTNSKKKSTLQPTLHFGDVCDLENATSLQNVRNAGEPDSLTPIRHPNTDLSPHRAYLRHKCTDTLSLVTLSGWMSGVVEADHVWPRPVGPSPSPRRCHLASAKSTGSEVLLCGYQGWRGRAGCVMPILLVS